MVKSLRGVHRVRLPIPPSADLSADGEVLARRLALCVMENMEQTFGEIEIEGRRIVWTTHDWQKDGTSSTCVSIHLSEASTSILTRVALNGRSPHPGGWVWALIAIILVAAITVGIWRGSILLGVTILIAGFGSWVGFDARRQIAAERRRTIDTGWWDAHLEACVRQASEPSGQ
jgi:hypothetical protein